MNVRQFRCYVVLVFFLRFAQGVKAIPKKLFPMTLCVFIVVLHSYRRYIICQGIQNCSYPKITVLDQLQCFSKRLKC